MVLYVLFVNMIIGKSELQDKEIFDVDDGV
jgi:hypothetical protein